MDSTELHKPLLASITPFFIVADLAQSTAYYIERLGFELDFQGPPDDVYYAQAFEVADADGYVIAFFQLRPGTRR